MKFRHIIFDLDGTLVDSAQGIQWSVERALEECGLPPLVAPLAPFLGPPIRRILAQVTGSGDGPMLDTLENAFRTSYDNEGWCMTRCFPGTAAALRELARYGLGLWLATNKPSIATARILSALEIERYFNQVVCRDSRRPAYESKAEMLAALIARRGLCRDQCLMVGDTAEDRQAAEAAEIRCAIVRQGITKVMEMCV